MQVNEKAVDFCDIQESLEISKFDLNYCAQLIKSGNRPNTTITQSCSFSTDRLKLVCAICS